VVPADSLVSTASYAHAPNRLWPSMRRSTSARPRHGPSASAACTMSGRPAAIAANVASTAPSASRSIVAASAPSQATYSRSCSRPRSARRSSSGSRRGAGASRAPAATSTSSDVLRRHARWPARSAADSSSPAARLRICVAPVHGVTVRGGSDSNAPHRACLGFEAKLWQAADKCCATTWTRPEYKHVVLGLIFLKYISDAFEERHAQLRWTEAGDADPEDRDEYRRRERVLGAARPRAGRRHLQAQAKQPDHRPAPRRRHGPPSSATTRR
jgi:hypothetical protein